MSDTYVQNSYSDQGYDSPNKMREKAGMDTVKAPEGLVAGVANLTAIFSELRQTFTALEKKLEPVLLPEVSSGEEGNKPSAGPEASSLGRAMDDLYHDINELRNHILEIKGRVEL